jgi:hypothetical protein
MHGQPHIRCTNFRCRCDSYYFWFIYWRLCWMNGYEYRTLVMWWQGKTLVLEAKFVPLPSPQQLLLLLLKGTFVPAHNLKVCCGSRHIARPFYTLALDGGDWSTSRQSHYSLSRRVGRTQSLFGRFWRGEKPLPGFETRNIQPLANRYTD